MNETGIQIIGTNAVSVFIPSRYADGSLIDSSFRDTVKNEVTQFYAEPHGFGAATQEDVEGVWCHDEGPGKRIVDEKITRIYAKVPEEKYNDNILKEQFLGFVSTIGEKLNQEAMYVEWGPEGILIFPDKRESDKKSTFCELTRSEQERLVTIAWRRVSEGSHISILLSLDGWEPSFAELKDNPNSTLLCEKRKGKDISRAYEWTSNDSLKKTDIPEIKAGDYVFSQTNANFISIWAMTSKGLIGPKDVPLAKPHVSRIAVEIGIALLNGSSELSLEVLLSTYEITNKFYKDYRTLLHRVTANYIESGLHEKESRHEARILLHRIMFLRFLEYRKWLNNDYEYLRSLYKNHSGNFFADSLKPLFYEQLDLPEEKRKKQSQIPFLNGGLFSPYASKDVSLPDSLFDPSIRDSILAVFYKYSFIMDERTDNKNLFSIDPSMFGHVMESLCSENERKEHGVHYTPLIIGRTLATEAILNRITTKLGKEYGDIRSFFFGEKELNNIRHIQHILDTLHSLKIIDPAVGSGSLLIAALSVLMDFTSRCYNAKGIELKPGGPQWGEEARRFIKESLYGVDIDPLAVEITQLRLWLSVAIADNQPQPLPELGFNIFAGDSLKVDEVSRELTGEGEYQSDLEFGEIDKIKNQLRSLLNEFRKLDSYNPEKSRALMNEITHAQKRLYILITKAGDTINDESIPFCWELQFSDVYKGANKGFDIVIANPPYIRMHYLPKKLKSELKNTYTLMASGNSDIYLAFIEKGLQLAGKEGELAYIVPSFARTKSGGPLREFLMKKGALERLVEFRDIQVFKSSTNYATLLFAGNKRRNRTQFTINIVPPSHWPPQDDNVRWLLDTPSEKVKYQGKSPWLTITNEESYILNRLNECGEPLGELFTISVGIQTSRDSFYLFDRFQPSEGDEVSVFAKELDQYISLESGILRPCAKGSKDIIPYRFKNNRLVLWPYDNAGRVLTGKVLERDYPLAWSYIKKHETKLKSRKMGIKGSEQWWRFGREQGIVPASVEKIIVPSLLRSGCAFRDKNMKVACTASGKGGGGAWYIEKKPECDMPLQWILAVLNSSLFWEWLVFMGDPKKDGWRGVDKSTLEIFPIPHCNNEMLKDVETMQNRLYKNDYADDVIREIDTYLQKKIL